MTLNNGYTRIETDESGREVLSHGNREYPFAYYYEDVWAFDFHCIDWHWHPEVELVYVERGTMSVLIGAERLTVGAGNGIFVNSGVIHRFEATESVIIPNVVFDPGLLAQEDSLVYRKYIWPILTAGTSYQIYRPDSEWQQEILLLLQEIFRVQTEERDRELETVRLLMKLWGILYRNTPLKQADLGKRQISGKQIQLQRMMQYIQENYQKTLTLDDIADSVLISKSGVQKLFTTYLQTSPIEYLVRYRLQCAASLLTATDRKIEVISQDTGFHDVAYFCRKFKGLYGMTPTQYRLRRKSWTEEKAPGRNGNWVEAKKSPFGNGGIS